MICHFPRVVWIVVALPWLSAGPAFAAETATDDVAQAAGQLSAALKAEMDGDLLARQRLLAEVQQQFPDYAPARWQQGEMLSESGEWIDIATSVERAAANPRLSVYERRRASLPDNVASHLGMATWCAEQKLFDQCRSHLNRVLEFEPDNQQARTALGFVLVGSEWMSPEQIQQLLVRSETAAQSVLKFGPQLQEIVAMLTSADSRQQTLGLQKLKQLHDPLAVPAVEFALATPAPGPSQIAVDWFASVDNVEASQVLARYSLFHPMPEVRAHATLALKPRPLHDFVPDMLNMLSAPVSSMIVPAFDRRGNLTGYRQAFAQEKFDKTDFVIVDRGFELVNLRFRVNPGTANVAQSDVDAVLDQDLRDIANAERLNTGLAVERANLQIAQRNARISAVLSEVADAEFNSDPTPMWKWWDDYNQTKYQSYKPERYRRNGLVDRVPRYQFQVSCECFVAGTPVMTLRGLRAIERVAVGDSVLCRDLDSGELGWKPVLRFTTRPPEPTTIVSVGTEQLKCTAGHLFWVSGKGWQKASELKAGDVLHAADEPVVVTRTAEAATAPTFNLQIADHANYFVGKQLVLSHDVTPREATRELVPGSQRLAQKTP